MICGGAKAQLASRNLKFAQAAPTTVVGKVLISRIIQNATAGHPFRTAGGDFVIEVNLTER
jgi:hypothetical protein